MRLRDFHSGDFAAVLEVINAAAAVYRDVIPADCWHLPYMPSAELSREIEDGVRFFVGEIDGQLAGAMGLQDRGEVALVRHAYVAPGFQRRGLGEALLRMIRGEVEQPLLVGTWAAAWWAVDFYRRNGFTLIDGPAKDALLLRFWAIPARQVETSVVLADRRGLAFVAGSTDAG